MPGGTTGPGDDWTFSWRLLILLTLPVPVLGVVWLVLRIRRKLFERSLRKIPYSQKQVKRIYKHLLWLVSHAKVNPSPTETLGEFAGRADQAWPSKLYIMSRVADIYGKSCYAAEPLSKAESGTLQNYVEALERREFIHLGVVRHWIYQKVLSML
jgi:hypothetical protein